MKIAIIVEGDTERAFLPHLREFLKARLAGRMPKLDAFPCHGRLPKEVKLKQTVERLLSSGKEPADAVIALTDVYTGTNPPDFADADDAKAKMRTWVGPNSAFHPHAAQYEFEAWLLPFWNDIQRLAGHNRAAPSATPEQVNHNSPPSRRIRELFLAGKSRMYIKTRDAGRISRQRSTCRRAGLCGIEGSSQHDSYSMSGRANSLIGVDSTDLRQLVSKCLRNHNSSMTSAQRRYECSRLPSMCSSKRLRTASGRNSPRLRRHGIEQDVAELVLELIAKPAADRNTEAHLRPCSDRRGQEIGECLLEHDLGTAAARLHLAVERHRRGQLDDSVVQKWSSAFQAVRHAGQVDLDQEVAG